MAAGGAQASARSCGVYSTCLFCNQPLGTNETIERFPVGRRLAFDAARGRLWVVCRQCERWNLTPIEERWEAIEDCERRYGEARKRVATDNVGLARVDDGLDLIRIGEPLRPEFAAWRYGDQFGRRRRRQFVKVGFTLGAVGAVVAGGVVASGGLGGLWTLFQGAKHIVHGLPETVIARVPDDGELIRIQRKHLKDVRFGPASGAHDWTLRIPMTTVRELKGPQAVAAIQQLLPAVNRFGASKDEVKAAVSEIEAAGDPARFFARIAQNRRAPLVDLQPELRLALEMAMQEDAERRALQGELAALAERWREAEEIAAIPDDLLLPKGVPERLRVLAERVGRATGIAGRAGRLISPDTPREAAARPTAPGSSERTTRR